VEGGDAAPARPGSDSDAKPPRVGAYRLTVRRGPHVERERCDTLEAAIALAADHVRRAPGRAPVEAFNRRYEPGEQIALRIELKGPGGSGGLDVLGDGAVIAFTGRFRREQLEGADPYAALRAALQDARTG